VHHGLDKSRKMNLSDLLPHCDGLRLVRDKNFSGLAYLGHKPRSKSELLFLGDRKFLPRLLGRNCVGGVITTDDIAEELPDFLGVLVHEKPMQAFFAIHQNLVDRGVFYRQVEANLIDPTARIHPSAIIAAHSVRIGCNAVIGPNVIVHPRSTIGDNTIVRDGSVIGSEGFEYKRLENRLVPIPHAGGVTIGPDCEVQALCAIDAGLFGNDTLIGQGCKLDNFVHIAHGVVVGDRCLFAAAAMLAGAVTVGNDVRIDPNSSIGHEITIGDGAYVSMGAVVGTDVAPGQRVTGNLAIEHSLFLRFWSQLRTGRLTKK
jgi:UDP-3-O-[3-hydroxymyristoyl] glucosamine N-acyltransferase